MHRLRITMLALLLVGSATAAGAATRTYHGFNVGISNAPPPPRIYDTYRSTDLYLVPGTQVYVANTSDHDMFRYGRYWYLMRDGYWYRARRYQGPYVAVDVRRVPYAVISVPQRHWRHHPNQGRWRQGVWVPRDDRWYDDRYQDARYDPRYDDERDWRR
jgi:hypothetical protein